jgi:hypothetical protein
MAPAIVTSKCMTLVCHCYLKRAPVKAVGAAANFRSGLPYAKKSWRRLPRRWRHGVCGRGDVNAQTSAAQGAQRLLLVMRARAKLSAKMANTLACCQSNARDAPLVLADVRDADAAHTRDGADDVNNTAPKVSWRGTKTLIEVFSKNPTDRYPDASRTICARKLRLDGLAMPLLNSSQGDR